MRRPDKSGRYAKGSPTDFLIVAAGAGFQSKKPKNENTALHKNADTNLYAVSVSCA